MKCKTCKFSQTCKTCEGHETCDTLIPCVNCSHRENGGHKFEIFQSQNVCVFCGLVSREPRLVNYDRLVFCANMQKQYVPKPQKPRKPKEPKKSK